MGSGKWMFSSLLEPFGSLLMRDGRWDLSWVDDDLSGQSFYDLSIQSVRSYLVHLALSLSCLSCRSVCRVGSTAGACPKGSSSGSQVKSRAQPPSAYSYFAIERSCETFPVRLDRGLQCTIFVLTVRTPYPDLVQPEVHQAAPLEWIVGQPLMRMQLDLNLEVEIVVLTLIMLAEDLHHYHHQRQLG